MDTEFDNEIEEMNLRYAVNGPVQSKLIDILPALTKSKLSSLASEYEIAGRSKMNKSDLVVLLSGSITDFKYLEGILLITRPKELRLFERIMEVPELKDADIAPGDYLYLMNKGLVFSFYSDEELHFVVPSEVKAAYKKINCNEFRKTYARYQLIYNYICALVNLYGIYKPELLLDIFNSHNEDKLDHLELMSTYWQFSLRQQIFYKTRGYFASDYFNYGDTDDELNELDHRYEKQDHYIPEKEELLKYGYGLYYEVTPQLVALRNFILNNVCKDKELIDELIDDIQLACSDSWRVSMQDIFYEFERRNIGIKNKKVLEELVHYIVEVINNTRLWINGGHTPKEMRPAVTSNLLQAGNQAAIAKIGRNEPCPCGSGKKYKKCCGSN